MLDGQQTSSLDRPLNQSEFSTTLSEEQIQERKKGVNMGYLFFYLFTIAIGMFQFGKHQGMSETFRVVCCLIRNFVSHHIVPLRVGT